ncbi:MAG: nicotinate phosphoribosyltransferase [Dehalococcoidia bacterium]|nr:nicotinate phosphoribosyltransferase [Dehalococcoidia bacterium]
MWVTGANAALLTDLYELTMAASYFEHRMNHPATFDLFVRHLPPHRNFLIACGLEDALSYLEDFHFEDEAIAYLQSLGLFKDEFLRFLRSLRFSGEVSAIAEGEAYFPEEPVVRVTAPLIEAQVVETFLLNCLNFQSLIASKAARVAIACGQRQFVDFSPRRDHGADAALKAARASYIGGAAATSNVLAGQVYGLPVSGTMAHSFVMSFEHEVDSFVSFARTFPHNATLLIDTYDTLEGARNAVRAAKLLEPEGIKIQGVRLDSGDVAGLAVGVRHILDEGGLGHVGVFASGDLDEFRIAGLLARGAPVDAFGVGTQLGVSADSPALGGVYKLVEDPQGPKIKLSSGKRTLPGRKQVYRMERGGELEYDLIALEAEPPPAGGRPLLECVMAKGRRTSPAPPLSAARERCRVALAALPSRLRALEEVVPGFPVRYSEPLSGLLEVETASHLPKGPGL